MWDDSEGAVESSALTFDVWRSGSLADQSADCLFLPLCLVFLSSEIVDHIERLLVLKEIVRKFPQVNYEVFKYVITHLNRYGSLYPVME